MIRPSFAGPGGADDQRSPSPFPTMLLTLTLTQQPATDLGYLLHKHPDRVQEFALPFGVAHVFYPEASEERCTAALLLDVDPVGLIRRGVRFGRLDQYVNDRPYVASSFLSVALSRVFGTAMAGRCDPRPELPAQLLPLEARLAVLPVAGGEEIARRLFEPLGYTLEHAHVDAALGDQDLRDPYADAGDRAQELDQIGVRCGRDPDPGLDVSDRLVERVDVGEQPRDENAVVVDVEPASERLLKLRDLLPHPTLGELGQDGRVGDAREERLEHRSRRDRVH